MAIEFINIDDCLAVTLPYFAKPFYVDFNTARFRQARYELLLKAIAAKKLPTVCDLTAGFGQDAYVMHQYGCRLQLVERSAVIGQLLQDGLRRAQVTVPLFIGEANDFIAQCQQMFDVIYLDPLFPASAATALAKKNAQILRLLAQEDPNPADLFWQARKIARHRMVVKRPRLGAPLVNDPTPDIVYRGKCVRFDVYLV